MHSIQPHHVAVPAAGIAGELAARGLGGPVLVVADDATIAACAPAWAASFSAGGIVHRVVVAGVDAAAAAADLGPRVVVGAGSPASLAAAAAAAAAFDVPLVSGTHPIA